MRGLEIILPTHYVVQIRPLSRKYKSVSAITPYYEGDGAETATDAGSETTKTIRKKHRIRFCGEHMKGQTCKRQVNGGRCSHCTSEEADQKKAAAKVAVKAELAALDFALAIVSLHEVAAKPKSVFCAN